MWARVREGLLCTGGSRPRRPESRDTVETDKDHRTVTFENTRGPTCSRVHICVQGGCPERRDQSLWVSVPGPTSPRDTGQDHKVGVGDGEVTSCVTEGGWACSDTAS